MSLDSKKSIRAAVTQLDRCPVHEKLRCHELSAGQKSRLVWSFTDNAGIPLNLGVTNSGDSDSASYSESVEYPYTFKLRLREITGYCPDTNPVFTVNVTIEDHITGQVVSDPLPLEIAEAAGVYQEEWGIYEGEDLIYSNSCSLFVRRSLFSRKVSDNQFETGPPTIEEIRLSLRDHVAENQLLQNREFDAAEIVQAVVRPLQYWNEIAPAISPAQTTITFPFRELWMQGIQAYLLEIAAHHYRRNHLPYNAGGVAVDDKQKDNPYSQAFLRTKQQFEENCRNKKIEINQQLFYGSISSPYSRYFW